MNLEVVSPGRMETQAFCHVDKADHIMYYTMRKVY